MKSFVSHPLLSPPTQDFIGKSRLESVNENDSTMRKELVIEELAAMKNLLRFLQLLCENHNRQLQNLLRIQLHNRNSYNIVLQTTKYLGTYGLALQLTALNVGNVIQVGAWERGRMVCVCDFQHKHTLLLTPPPNLSAAQALRTLAEYCQGPCPENQEMVASHESNGLDIVIKELLL